MFSQFITLWRLMQGQRARYSLALICLLFATGLNYLVPLVGSVTLDHAIAGKLAHDASPLLAATLSSLGGSDFLRAHLWIAVVAMVGITALSGAFSYFKGWLAALASDGIARRLKNRLYDHLNHLPARYHDRASTGDLVQRCTSDVETTRQFLAVQVMEIGNSLILIGTVLPLMLLLNVPMTLVSFVLIPPLVIYSYVYFVKVRHVFKAVDESEGALTSVAQENLTGIRVVRAFARQDYEIKRFAEPNATYRDASLRMIRLMAWYWSLSDLVSIIQTGLTLIIGAWWVARGDLSIGTLFAFITYLGIMLWPVRQMGRILTDLGKTTVALTRIREILDEPEESGEEVEPAPAKLFPNADGWGVRVRNLTFAHPGMARPAIENVSFDVAPGETLAIIGPSGAGKSTLMHLLLRLYDYEAPASLRIHVPDGDSCELNAIPRKVIRSHIGVVMQEPFLYARTLRDNLRLARHDAPQHEIEEAARDARIHEAISSFEKGYDTLIGERGITLSGGQRQRMAIARALLKRPPLLLLDDALSAVDGETETLILNALQRRRGKSTTIVIAHRLSTLAHADRVLVFERGRIVQSGTHAELAENEGLYRRLWKIQNDVVEKAQPEKFKRTVWVTEDTEL